MPRPALRDAGQSCLQAYHNFNELDPSSAPPSHSQGYKIWQIAADIIASGTPLHLSVPCITQNLRTPS